MWRWRGRWCWLGGVRLSFYFSATFLSFFCAAKPQLLRNFLESIRSGCIFSSARSARGAKIRSKSNQITVRFMGWRQWKAAATSYSAEFERFFAPHRSFYSEIVARLRVPVGPALRQGSEFSRQPATFGKFRAFATPPQISEKLSRKSDPP